MAIVAFFSVSKTIRWLCLLAFLSLFMLQSCLADDQLKLLRLSSRKLCPSCNTRFELYPFFRDSLAAQESISYQTGHRVWIPIRLSVSAAVVVMLLGSFLWHMNRGNALLEEQENDQETEIHTVTCPDLSLCRLDLIGKVRKYFSGEIKMDNLVDTRDVPLFSLNVIHQATEHFSVKNKLGEGGFGCVYKGLLEDGKAIAVKRLSYLNSRQGREEFKKEVEIISRLQHNNVVRLLGYCTERNEMIVIYEYMPNKSLHDVLFGLTDSEAGQVLEWKTRIRILKGIAQGLLYLHEGFQFKIIHRDLKPRNVLLDNAMNPKISDFGLADIIHQMYYNKVTTRISGTFGYMAPEYMTRGEYSIKTDIFSFGVLLLEIISRRRNSTFSEYGMTLLGYTWKLWCDGEALELMDPALIQSCDRTELIKCINIGLLCVQNEPGDRPTMSSIVLMLESTDHDINLPQPNQPAFGRSPVISVESSFQNDFSINEVTLSIELAR